MRKVIMVVFLLGLTSQLFAQDVEQLKEVVVTAINYKYLSAVDNSEAAIPVQTLERQAARFNVEEQDLYIDDYATYNVSFYIPDGKIVAAYNEKGEIVKTIEKFENVQLPEEVRVSLKSRFPNWEVVKDVYMVSYTKDKGAKKIYKIKMKNGDKTMRVKLDHLGNYM
ncbi:nicotinate-nucleotide adenylyltransferase [Aureitalea marina]|uniref:Nicotinate-nucleotide adenylyltransferase n=1 Tax=Aureitalea marina TaxID=930804 RepID=A0A2S7KQ60_9FLAO|nr:nicotinate-nucleotide adenylyltransferase [Aureitalea marina]PQB04750.1 nicotinate-nucleotide adenylyltransferase [Aureitalea marina]